MLEDVLKILTSPELESQTVYRPLRRKRDPLFLPDGDDNTIQLTDSTDSQSGASSKRIKRRAYSRSEPGAGPSASSSVPAAQTPVLSSRVTDDYPPKSRGVTPITWQAAVPPNTAPPFQKKLPACPTPGFGQGYQQIRFLAAPAGYQLQPPYHEAAPPAQHVPLIHESLPPVVSSISELPQQFRDVFLERVREVVPDVLPAHVFKLFYQYKTAFSSNLLDVVIHILLENPSYPRDVKGKGKARAAVENFAGNPGDFNTNMDYTHSGDDKRSGPAYGALCLDYLHSNFPDVDHSSILKALTLHGGRYTPTYLHLLQQGATAVSVVPISPNPCKRGNKTCSKLVLGEDEFLKEHTLLVNKLENHHDAPAPDLIPQVKEEDVGDIECGCCFSEYSFSKMAQCTDTHLFCTSCVTSYASAKLGEQNSDLRCMDISGCRMRFPDSELRRVLPEKLFELYECIRQRRDIELAGLEGLEECPFCDFRVVMDADFHTDKVLKCQKEDCGKVSCRKCKKEDHLPKSCEEVEEDKKVDGKHAIEEAMTRALMRNCPKCQKAFIKDYGCNKMTCSYCQTVSCYVCRSIIRGYEHFDHSRRGDARYPSSSSKKKCPLWDAEGDRHASEVAAAASKALKEYKALHPDVRDEDIRVELPPPPPPDMRMQFPLWRAPRFPMPPPYVQVHHAHNVHVPIAHPVEALPFPPAAPPFNLEHILAHGPPHLGDLDRRPPLRPDAQMMYPMPPAYNPLLGPPFPMPPLPPPQLHRVLPPFQVAAVHAPRRVAGRGGKRRG